MVKSEVSAAATGDAAARKSTAWSRAEHARLLRAWLHVLKHHPSTLNSSAVVPDDVLCRTQERFEALLRRKASGAASRPRMSVGNKMEQLARTYRVAAAYNEQQQDDACSDGDLPARNNNAWLALSPKQQLRTFESYHNRSSFVAIDAELFSLLAAIQRERDCTASTQPNSSKAKAKPVWTKGEEWILISAWRQVVERTAAPARENMRMVALVYERFVSLSRSGMPRRTRGSVKAYLANLVTLYRLVTEFNVLSRDGNSADWFAATPEARTQYLSESNVGRVNRIAAFDRDTFHAMEHIMRRLDSGGDSAVGGRSSISGATIDLLSDTDSENEGDDDDDDDETDWEMLPATPSAVVTTTAAVATSSGAGGPHSSGSSGELLASDRDGFPWRTLHDASAWTSERLDEPMIRAASIRDEPTARFASSQPPSRTRDAPLAPPRYRTSAIDELLLSSSPTADATSLSYEPPSVAAADADTVVDHGSARKRMKLDPDECTTPATGKNDAKLSRSATKQQQQFVALLAKLKKERRADKAMRRHERTERQELVALIAEERKLRRKDKKERQRERREWELERDKLKLKLKSLRAKLRLARRQFATS